jgi:hypothetical protein
MNAKYRAKRAREEVEDWDGLNTATGDAAEVQASSSDSESGEDEEDENPVDSLLTSLGPRLDTRSKGQLSKRAALFFDRPEFEGINIDDGEETPVKKLESPNADIPPRTNEHSDELKEHSASENGFEEVPVRDPEPYQWDDDSDEDKQPTRPGIPRYISR